MNSIKLMCSALAISACSTPGVLEIRSNSEESNGAFVKLIDFKQEGEPGEQLGSLPQKVSLDKLKGKQLTIAKSGFESQSFVFLPDLGDSNGLAIDLKPEAGTLSQRTGLPDKKLVDATLLLLKAYQALSTNQYQAAIDIAKQSHQLQETGPGPTIIEAIALWRLGENSKALQRLQATKTIYPQVSDLDTLIKAIQSN